MPIIEDGLRMAFSGKNDSEKLCCFEDPRQILLEAMQYSLYASAKRVRPLLCFAVFLMYKPKEELNKILPLALAIEMIHTYSLIHDDLPAMDNDDFRRGLPTCHKKFGEDVAILAGDTLNTFVWELIAQELPKYFSGEKVLLVIQEFAQALGLIGMAGGQMLDLKAPEQKRDLEYLLKMHNLKTGALLKAAVVLPAKIIGIDNSELQPLEVFGEKIGLLFQIVDDLLDVIGTKENIGKSLKKDLEHNKLTYVTFWGVEKTKEIAKIEAQEAIFSLNKLNNKNTAVLEDLIEYILHRNK